MVGHPLTLRISTIFCHTAFFLCFGEFDDWVADDGLALVGTSVMLVSCGLVNFLNRDFNVKISER